MNIEIKSAICLQKATQGFDKYLEDSLNVDGTITNGVFFDNESLENKFNKFDTELKNEILAFAKNYYLKGCFDMSKLMEI